MYAKVRRTRWPGTGTGCKSSSRRAYRRHSVSQRVTRRSNSETGRRSAHRSELLSLVGHGTHKKHSYARNPYRFHSGLPTCCCNSRAGGHSTGGNWSWRHGSSARSRTGTRYRRRTQQRPTHGRSWRSSSYNPHYYHRAHVSRASRESRRHSSSASGDHRWYWPSCCSTDWPTRSSMRHYRTH